MQDDEFEWDDDKAARNFAKHKVAFEDAKAAFRDPLAIFRTDRSEGYEEFRANHFGMVQGKLLRVTYTMRGDRMRILSARLAEPKEKREYHEQKRGRWD